jgi:hypothetical protein
MLRSRMLGTLTSGMVLINAQLLLYLLDWIIPVGDINWVLGLVIMFGSILITDAMIIRVIKNNLDVFSARFKWFSADDFFSACRALYFIMFVIMIVSIWNSDRATSEVLGTTVACFTMLLTTAHRDWIRGRFS